MSANGQASLPASSSLFNYLGRMRDINYFFNFLGLDYNEGDEKIFNGLEGKL